VEQNLQLGLNSIISYTWSHIYIRGANIVPFFNDMKETAKDTKDIEALAQRWEGGRNSDNNKYKTEKEKLLCSGLAHNFLIY